MKNVPRVIIFIGFMLLLNLLFYIELQVPIGRDEITIALMIGSAIFVLRELLYFKSKPECLSEIMCGGVFGFITFGHSFAFYLMSFLVASEVIFTLLDDFISLNFRQKVQAFTLPYAAIWSLFWLFTLSSFSWSGFFTLTFSSCLIILLTAFLVQSFINSEVEAA